jgi:hypothetical protein
MFNDKTFLKEELLDYCNKLYVNQQQNKQIK